MAGVTCNTGVPNSCRKYRRGLTSLGLGPCHELVATLRWPTEAAPGAVPSSPSASGGAAQCADELPYESRRLAWLAGTETDIHRGAWVDPARTRLASPLVPQLVAPAPAASRAEVGPEADM